MKKIGIIGLGLMGGSMGLALKKFVEQINIFGMDNNKNHYRYACNHNMIDYALTTDNLNEMDIIFIAVPVRAVTTVIQKIYPHLSKNRTIITDMGSTKYFIWQEIKNKFPDLNYIGGHPMTGREISGPEGAVSDLFFKKKYILIKEQKPIEQKHYFLEELLIKLQSQIIQLKPAEHDQLVAWSSHLPQLLATTLVSQIKTVKKENPLFPTVVGQGFLDMTRIAGSDPTMWLDIFLTNQEQVIKAIEGFETGLQEFKENLMKKDQREIIRLMSQGKQYRNQLLKQFQETKEGVPE